MTDPSVFPPIPAESCEVPSRETVSLLAMFLTTLNLDPILEGYLRWVPPRSLDPEDSQRLKMCIMALLFSPRRLVLPSPHSPGPEEGLWRCIYEVFGVTRPIYEDVWVGMFTRLGQYMAQDALTAQFVLHQAHWGGVRWSKDPEGWTLRHDEFPLWLTDHEEALRLCRTCDDPLAFLVSRGRGKLVRVGVISSQGFPLSSYVSTMEKNKKNPLATLRRSLQTHIHDPAIGSRWKGVTVILPRGCTATTARRTMAEWGQLIWEIEPRGSASFLLDRLDSTVWQEASIPVGGPFLVQDLGWHACYRTRFRIIAIQKGSFRSKEGCVRYLATNLRSSQATALEVVSRYQQECDFFPDQRLCWRLAYRVPRICYKGKQGKRLRGLTLLLLLANHILALMERLGGGNSLLEWNSLPRKVHDRIFSSLIQMGDVEFSSWSFSHHLAHSCQLNLEIAPVLSKGSFVGDEGEPFPW